MLESSTTFSKVNNEGATKNVYVEESPVSRRLADVLTIQTTLLLFYFGRIKQHSRIR